MAWCPPISKNERSRGRKPTSETDVCRPESGVPGTQRGYRKKALKPEIKRELVSYLIAQFAMSIRQACRTLSLSRTVSLYQPDTRRDEPAVQALTEVAKRYPRYGFTKLFQMLRRQGHAWKHKRVHRIYCLLKLNFRRKVELKRVCLQMFPRHETRCGAAGFLSFSPPLLPKPHLSHRSCLRRFTQNYHYGSSRISWRYAVGGVAPSCLSDDGIPPDGYGSVVRKCH